LWPHQITSSHLAMYSFFYDTATSGISTLSLHDALPICAPARNRGTRRPRAGPHRRPRAGCTTRARAGRRSPRRSRRRSRRGAGRSEEHTSELQSRENLVCRLLLEKKNIEEYEKVDLSVR